MDNTRVLSEGGQAPCCSFTGPLLVAAGLAVVLTSLCHHSHGEMHFSIWFQTPQSGLDPMGREITAVDHCTYFFTFCQANREPRAKCGHCQGDLHGTLGLSHLCKGTREGTTEPDLPIVPQGILYSPQPSPFLSASLWPCCNKWHPYTCQASYAAAPLTRATCYPRSILKKKNKLNSSALGIMQCIPVPP